MRIEKDEGFRPKIHSRYIEVAKESLQNLKQIKEALDKEIPPENLRKILRNCADQLAIQTRSMSRLFPETISRRRSERDPKWTGRMGDLVAELEEEAEGISTDIGTEWANGPISTETLNEWKQYMVDAINQLIPQLEYYTAAKDLAPLIMTEKDPLSEKVPQDVANKIGSFLSGKEGSLGAQMSQVAVLKKRPGVLGKKVEKVEGGRKTKKNRSSKKKTHGRRV